MKILAAAAIVIATSAQATATVTPYDVPGSSSTSLWGVNDHGVLVGGDDNGGFIDDHGVITTVNLGGTPGVVTGISNTGVAVGTDGTNSFIYQAGVTTAFAVAGADSTQIRGISSNGRYIAGVSTSPAGHFDGFVWDNVTSTLSPIVGPSGLNVGVVQGVNDNGVAVGSLSGSHGGLIFDSVHGTTSYYTDAYGLTSLRFRGIDDAGDVGGWAIDADGDMVGFFGTLSGGFDTFKLGEGGTLVYGLNNLGEAVGSYTDADGFSHGFIASPSAVPEASSAATMAFSLLVLGARLARRRKAA
jgi:hypothetical protein